MIRYSMSRVGVDWQCPRRRFWNYVFGGKGIVAKRRPLALEFGTLIHEGFSLLMSGERVDNAVLVALGELNRQVQEDTIEELVGATDNRVHEIRYLTEGLLRTLDKVVVPKLLEFHRPVRLESVVRHQHDGCELVSIPDAILERFTDEALVYGELKTASDIGPEWQKQWWKNVQLPAGALGVAATLGKPLTATYVIGLNKGYWSKQYERQESPLLYGYNDNGTLTAKYRNGLRKIAVWEFGVSAKDWVERLDLETLNKQVVAVGPIPFQAPLTAAWLRQSAIREKAIEKAKEQLFGGAPLREVEARQILDEVFPQRFKECEPPRGFKCAYGEACFIPSIERDPLASGLYEWRKPREATEAVLEAA